ncbi:ExbD/TolR family protein [candidate division CSSED10-310 bacterium]|uniref:ExbD/TolR family protein n=1 Tax=candidate division CSSED10-310 bacterium TaxID=2855610 RepID=A0ABV6YXM2_UNCC1
MDFKARQIIKPELNMTQLIDVVLLLLIFFMITSSFVVQPGLKVTLPKSSSQESQPENQLKLIVTKDNAVYLDNQRVRIENLRDELQKRMMQKEMQLLLIKADENVIHGFVVHIMDIARSLHLDVGIATRALNPDN